MLEFINLTKLSGNTYRIYDNVNLNLKTLFVNDRDINTLFVLRFRSAEGEHILDVCQLCSVYPEFIKMDTIRTILDHLNPEMIYTFATDKFKPNRMIRSFTNGDIPGDTVVTPFSIAANEATSMTDDASYPDLRISSDKFDLDNVFPIIDAKLRRCIWHDGHIHITNGVDLIDQTKNITFLSFGELDSVSVISLRDLLANDGYIGENVVPIVVIGGCLFYDTPWMYSFNQASNVINLNFNMISSELVRRGYEKLGDVLDDRDSFIILVPCNNIFIRDIPMISLSQLGRIFSYYESSTWKNHIDYICLSDINRTVHGITNIDEKYRNVATNRDPNEHHMYVDHIDVNMKMIQLVVS